MDDTFAIHFRTTSPYLLAIGLYLVLITDMLRCKVEI